MQVIKFLWGALITLATLWLTYGQYALDRKALRPTLTLSHEPSTKEFASRHGPYSHMYRLVNTGNLVARGATITAITRQEGSRPHEDQNKDLGDLMPGEDTKYEIYVHHVTEDKPGRPKYELTEDVVLSYKGESALRFWCEPTYEYVATFVYEEKETRWVYHRHHRPKEKQDCR